MIIESDNHLFLTYKATLIDTNKELAWAERSVITDPAKSWVLGRYVEADRANSNKQYWSLADLKAAQLTIHHAPLNIGHDPTKLVGHFVDTEMMYPVSGQAEGENPFIEALAVIYKAHFPAEYQLIQQAHEAGQLYFSMECVPQSITCSGDDGCGQEFQYDGPMSASYCSHITSRTAVRQLNAPHFTGGALIMPPVQPGWSNADVHSIVAGLADAADKRLLVEAAATDRQQLRDEWETQMAAVQTLERARTFNAEQRRKAAGSGAALPDGSFPIQNAQDLRNAIHAIGRAKDPAKAKAHIKKRAASLGLSSLIPDGW